MMGAALRGATHGMGRWILLAAVVSLAGGWLWLGNGSGAGGDAYLTAPVERGPIRNTVAATGTVQAVLTVQVGSQVTGRIASLHADFNSVVRAGQILARIDPANFEAQLERAKADLTDARAGVRTAEALVAMQKANDTAAKVTAQDAARALRRARELSAEGVVSSRELEVAEAAADQAAARLEQAYSQVRSAEAALEQARARVDQARAAVRIAEINLFYTVIASPVDGVVISRSVDVGQTVSASLQAPTLFTIANDLTKMQVVANVDEADIGSITPDSRVSFTVDAFPGETFTGTLNQIRLNPQTQQNVVTYSVIIDVGNLSLNLRPGMTANTTFLIAERAEALRLPNAALRFWPEGTPRGEEKEMIGGGAAARPDAVPETPPLPAAGEVIRFPAARPATARPHVIWVLGPEGSPEPRVVKIGISDGSASEVVEGDLKPGEAVIIGRNTSPEAMAARGNSPFAPPMGPMGPRRGGQSTGKSGR